MGLQAETSKMKAIAISPPRIPVTSHHPNGRTALRHGQAAL
jgi:hypothetical protein